MSLTSDGWTKFWREHPAWITKRREAFVGEQQFEGWTRSQIDERIAKCVELINGHVMVRVSRALSREDYDLHFKGTLPEHLDDPYFLLFYSLIYGVKLYQKKWGWKTKVDFVFDDRKAKAANAPATGILSFARWPLR